MTKSNNSGRRESVPPGGEEEKEMKNSRKMKKWGCVMLALMSGFVLPGIVQASSGLSDTTQTIGSAPYYIGIKGVSGNEVIIDRDLDAGAVGGYADSGSGSAEAKNNSVTVSDGTVKGDIYGGHAYSGSGSAEAKNNSVTVSGGTVYKGTISGGEASGKESKVIGNSANMSSGIVVGNVDGGYISSEGGIVAYNRVNITGGTIKGILHEIGGVNVAVIGGGIYGGSASGEGNQVIGNSISISGNTVNDYVGEMQIMAGGSASGAKSKVKGNSVTISGGTIANHICGGYAEGAESKVEGNSVTISGGTIANRIDGGRVSGTGSTAAGNSVTISGGTVTGEVYGGCGYAEGTGSTVTGNSVTLSGTADVSGASLYGGAILITISGPDIGTGETVKNNKLIINGWSGEVQSLNNFNGIDGGIEVRALAGGLDLTAGKRTVFVNTADGIHGGSLNPIEAKEMQAGVALTVSGNMGISENKDIYIDVTGVRASDQTVIAVESRAASVAAVGRGAEAVTDSLDTLRGSEEGLSTFASIIGSRSRYNTGSHADVNGWNGIVGTAWTRELTSGTLSCGAFYENGGGSYDTHNTINGRTYRGDGDTVYNGGGLLLRWETNGGTYTEASLRAGMVKNEVGPSLEFAGNRYGFKTENNYYGGHVGIGRIMERDDGDAWDIYGKYFHMHHEGDTVTVAGDEFAFDSVNSDRLRVGARYLDRKNDRFTGYYGLAYEYEFSGDTGGTANHHAMYTPSLQGSTVIGEIGFRGTPGEDSPWSFEVSLRGYAGKQEGISGAVTAAYSF